MHTIIPRDRKAAIVLAAVKGEALTRRPNGRPGPPLRATTVRTLAGTKEWSAFRPNKGIDLGLRSDDMISHPQQSK
ncbi:MAG: hypothetical protein ACREEK_01105, partial [Bradyrhizobium sp.]